MVADLVAAENQVHWRLKWSPPSSWTPTVVGAKESHHPKLKSWKSREKEHKTTTGRRYVVATSSKSLVLRSIAYKIKTTKRMYYPLTRSSWTPCVRICARTKRCLKPCSTGPSSTSNCQQRSSKTSCKCCSRTWISSESLTWQRDMQLWKTTTVLLRLLTSYIAMSEESCTMPSKITAIPISSRDICAWPLACQIPGRHLSWLHCQETRTARAFSPLLRQSQKCVSRSNSKEIIDHHFSISMKQRRKESILCLIWEHRHISPNQIL